MDLSILHKTIISEPKFRHKQIDQAVYVDLIDNWSLASNLPKDLREKLSRACPLEIKANIVSVSGTEATKKALITLADGLEIETVLIRQKDGRNTVCVSSQVGCPLACAFCATGQLGFSRNLTAQEIVEQVLLFMR